MISHNNTLNLFALMTNTLLILLYFLKFFFALSYILQNSYQDLCDPHQQVYARIGFIFDSILHYVYFLHFALSLCVYMLVGSQLILQKKPYQSVGI